jgi:hypothetical protein
MLTVACLAATGCVAEQEVVPTMTGTPADDGSEIAAEPAERRSPRPPRDPAILTILDGVSERLTVEANGRALHVAVRWPGNGRVAMLLVPPRGRPITPSSDGVTHERGPTFENYHVAEPEAGRWSVRLTGIDVPAEGTPVRVTVYQNEPPRRQVMPALRQRIDGATVSLAVETGQGEMSAYLWEFGDGAISREGPTVSHTYREPGIYRVSVAVQVGGRWRVVTADEPVDVP